MKILLQSSSNPPPNLWKHCSESTTIRKRFGLVASAETANRYQCLPFLLFFRILWQELSSVLLSLVLIYRPRLVFSAVPPTAGTSSASEKMHRSPRPHRHRSTPPRLLARQVHIATSLAEGCPHNITCSLPQLKITCLRMAL
jgi:hypothetical protein